MRAAFVLLAAALAGCAATGTQVSERAATQFEEGVTTEAQIVQKLGQPTSVQIIGGQRFISYTGMQYQVKGASFIPIVGMFAGGADYNYSTATYQIDSQGTLTKITYVQAGAGSRAGATPLPTTSREPSAIR